MPQPMTIFRRALTTAVLLALLPPAAGSALQIGEVEVTPRVFLQEGYDDNITLEKENKKSDFFTRLGLAVDARYEGRRQELGLSGRVDQQLFAAESDFNNSSQDFDVDYRWDLSKVDQVLIANAFTHAEDPSSFEDALGRASGRYSYFQNRFDLSYNRAINKQLYAKANIGVESYDVSRSDLPDSLENHLGLTMSYYQTSETIVSGIYEYSRRDFDPGTDSGTHGVLAGVRQYLSPQLSLDGSAGVSFIRAFNGRDLTEPQFHLSLNNEIDEQTVGRLFFDKEYKTNNYTEDIFDYWQAGASWARQLRERLGLRGSGFYGEGTYEDLNIKDRLGGVNVGLSYELKRDLNVGLDYSYSRTDSNSDARDYQKNLTMLSVNYTF